MNREPDIEALVTFLPTSEGGRQGPAFSGYRPNHLVLPDYVTTRVHEYIDTDSVSPGESARTRITFVTPEHYPHSMWPGRLVRVQEGGRLIGHAKVLQVCNPDLLGEPSVPEPNGYATPPSN